MATLTASEDAPPARDPDRVSRGEKYHHPHEYRLQCARAWATGHDRAAVRYSGC